MFSVIVNPIAGNGVALSLLGAVEALLRAHGLEFETSRSEFPGHATAIARAAATAGASGIVSIGGDGTLSEIVNGIGESGTPLYIVPAGTGNDFVKTLFKKRLSPLDTFAGQLNGEDARIDLCKVNDRYFVNVAGAGFDVEVLRQTLAYKHLGRGLKPYLLGVRAALKMFKPLECELTLDGERMERQMTIVSVANGRYIGGGMRVAPRAVLTDGLLDVLLVKRLGKAAIACLMPTFIPGWHVKLPVVESRLCREVRLKAKDLTINIDGDLEQVSEALFKIIPNGLRVRSCVPTPTPTP